MPHISRGNTKLGAVVNVSLNTDLTCTPNAPCRSKCYAKAIEKRNKIPNLQWLENAIIAAASPEVFFEHINTYLKRYPAPWFRWHVGGDIPTQSYFREMKKTAKRFPETKFLCFTKKHNFTYRDIPGNLSVVFSMWPGWGNTRKKMPRSWVQDGTETRIPKNAVQCSGRCSDCHICWDLAKSGSDVWFKLHS